MAGVRGRELTMHLCNAGEQRAGRQAGAESAGPSAKHGGWGAEQQLTTASGVSLCAD
jgi:hypothetical protein